MAAKKQDLITRSDSEDDLEIVDEKITNYGKKGNNGGVMEVPKEIEDTLRASLMKQNPGILPKGNFKLKIYSKSGAQVELTI